MPPALLLNYVDCDDNALTQLDVTANWFLSELRCAGNQLTSLDLSRNGDLNILRCSDNALTNLKHNDTDPDAGQDLTVTVTPTTAPTHGTVTLNPSGTFSSSSSLLDMVWTPGASSSPVFFTRSMARFIFPKTKGLMSRAKV